MTDFNVFGYVRVSTKEQKLEVQIDKIKRFCEFKGYNLVNIFEDKSSGKNINREGFTKMIELLKDNSVGINGVVIVKLDRMGRSVRDLIEIMKFFKDHDIHVSSIDDNIDTSTKEGRLFFHFVAAFSEYERELIIDRTEAGKDFARSIGVKFGRPVKKIKMKEIQQDIALGIPKTVIARKYNMSESTLYRKLNEYNSEVDKLVEKAKQEVLNKNKNVLEN